MRNEVMSKCIKHVLPETVALCAPSIILAPHPSSLALATLAPITKKHRETRRVVHEVWCFGWI